MIKFGDVQTSYRQTHLWQNQEELQNIGRNGGLAFSIYLGTSKKCLEQGEIDTEAFVLW